MSKNTNTPPAPGANGQPLSADLQRLLAGAGTAGPQGQADGSPPVVAQPNAPEELDVDVGDGAKRRVPVKDLVSAFLQREGLAAEREVVQASLAELGQNRAIAALGERLKSLPAERRQQVLALLDPRTAAPARAAQRQRQEDVDDADLLAEGGDEGARDLEGVAALPPGFLEDFQQMRDAMQVLGTRESARIRSEQAKSTGERVDTLMGDYPIFGEHAAAAKFARKHIMSQVVADPKANVDDIVKAAARELHVLTKPAETPAERPGARTTPLTLPGNRAPNARSLRSGDVRRAAYDAVRRASG